MWFYTPDGYILTQDGFIYRLCIGLKGKTRICKNVFNARLSFMSKCVEYKDFDTKEAARNEFERLKTVDGNTYKEPEYLKF